MDKKTLTKNLNEALKSEANYKKNSQNFLEKLFENSEL